MSEHASAENKKLSNYITNIVGTNRTVDRYWDEYNENFIDIFKCDDPLYKKINYYGTLGVSDYPNEIEMKDHSLKNIPTELLMGGYKEFDMVPNILSTTGFYITKNGWAVQPGSVFMRMVEMYYASSDMKHIMFVSPFLWPDKLKPLELETKTVNWLLCVPISDQELEYRNQNGAAALRDVFDETDIDIFDMDRKSVF